MVTMGGAGSSATDATKITTLVTKSRDQNCTDRSRCEQKDAEGDEQHRHRQAEAAEELVEAALRAEFDHGGPQLPERRIVPGARLRGDSDEQVSDTGDHEHQAPTTAARGSLARGLLMPGRVFWMTVMTSTSVELGRWTLHR